MRVGIPTEIKNNEFRVAITPSGVAELVRRGHEVLIESGAGDGSAISDADFKRAGAQLVTDADEVWAEAELLLKVKEPIEAEYSRKFHRAATLAGTDVLHPVPYSARHAGASHDFLEGSRTLSEVKGRGRWRSDASVQRYTKATRAQQQAAKLSEQTVAYGMWVRQNLNGLLRGRVAPRKPPFAA